MAASSTYASDLLRSFDPSTPPTVIIFSIDMDGALLSSRVKELITAKADLQLPFKENYEALPEETKTALREATIQALEQAHPKLIEHILSSIPDGTTAIFISGSNRQTRKRDHEANMTNRNGSSFIALQAFVDIITLRLGERAKAELDTMLLEDLVNEQEPGTYFEHALQRGCTAPLPASLHKKEVEVADAHTEVDESKRLLLYAQMQHMVTKYKAASMTFHFYDDDAHPSTSRKILAPLQLFFGKQVIDSICTFLDNCMHEIIFKIYSTQRFIIERREKLLARKAAADQQATSSTPATESAQQTEIGEPTAGLDVLPLLESFRETMEKAITQLKHDFQTFQYTQEDASKEMRDILAAFQNKQMVATETLRNELTALQQAHPSEQSVYATARAVAPFDIVEEIAILLHMFLPTVPDELPMKLTDTDARTRIVNVLEQSQSQKSQADAIPANMSLHLHQYVGPKESCPLEPSGQPALLTHKTPIQGAGQIDANYAQNYCALSRQLVENTYHHIKGDDQPSFCRSVLDRWYEATITQQALPRATLPASASSSLSPPAPEKKPSKPGSWTASLGRSVGRGLDFFRGPLTRGSKKNKTLDTTMNHHKTP